jgi:hypothetical protein
MIAFWTSIPGPEYNGSSIYGNFGAPVFNKRAIQYSSASISLGMDIPFAELAAASV